MFYKPIVKELSCILGLAVITAFTVNFLSPRGIALVGEWDTSKGVITARAKNDLMDHELEIDILTAKKIYFNGKSVFVDARSREMYEEGHIKDAASMPVYEFDDLIEGFMNDYPASVTVVTYCTGRECEDSHHLAQYLSEAGYSDIRVYVDGYAAWKQRGYPVEE